MRLVCVALLCVVSGCSCGGRFQPGQEAAAKASARSSCERLCAAFTSGPCDKEADERDACVVACLEDVEARSTAGTIVAGANLLTCCEEHLAEAQAQCEPDPFKACQLSACESELTPPTDGGASPDGGGAACPWKGDIAIGDPNPASAVVLDDGGLALVRGNETWFYGCDLTERRRVESHGMELEGEIGPLEGLGYQHAFSRTLIRFDGSRREISAREVALARGLIDSDGVAYQCNGDSSVEALFADGGSAVAYLPCASLHARSGRVVVVGNNSGVGGVGTLTSLELGVDAGVVVSRVRVTDTRRVGTGGAAVSSTTADALVPGVRAFPLSLGAPLPPLIIATAGSGGSRSLWLEELDLETLQVSTRTCSVQATIDTTFQVRAVREEPTRYLVELVLASTDSNCRPSSLSGVSPKTWNNPVCSMPGGGFGPGQLRSHRYALTLPKAGATSACATGTANVLPDLLGPNGLKPDGRGDYYAVVSAPSSGAFKQVIRKTDSAFKAAQTGGGGAGTCTATYEGPTGDIQRDAQCQAAWSAICAMQSPAGYCAVYNDPGFGSGPACPYCP